MVRSDKYPVWRKRDEQLKTIACVIYALAQFLDAVKHLR
jgi:hypothetical protein